MSVAPRSADNRTSTARRSIMLGFVEFGEIHLMIRTRPVAKTPQQPWRAAPARGQTAPHFLPEVHTVHLGGIHQPVVVQMVGHIVAQHLHAGGEKSRSTSASSARP